MPLNLKTIAFLMLLAGLSLGIFASRAVRALGPRDAATAPGAGGPSAIEQQVGFYQRFYQLDPQRTDQVRQTLLRYDRGVRDKLLELRHRHADEFSALLDTATSRINEILEPTEGQDGR
jgi:hypothetical protein